MKKEYPIEFEIAGPCACFTRPDTGDLPRSYAGPTFSAVRGMAQAIAWWKGIEIKPTLVQICKPLRWMKFTTNYRGPYRKTVSVKDGSSFQQSTVVLFDVCYKIFADVECITQEPINKRHAFQEFFMRRLKRGVFFTLPYLGLRSMGATYVGPLRADTTANSSVNLDIPIMYRDGYHLDNGKAIFDVNVQIRNGELRYAV